MSSKVSSMIRWLLASRFCGDVEQCERGRRVLIVANLPCRAAGLLLGLSLPRRPLVVLPPGGPLGWVERILARRVEHIQLDMNNPLFLKRLTHWLRQGRPVVMFPEGRISDGQGLLKIYPVAALAATNSGATVVPVAISAARKRIGSPASPVARGWLFRVLTPPRIEASGSRPAMG